MAKTAKKKLTKYDEKLVIKGSFSDVIGVSVGKPPSEKKPKTKGKK
ncbi:MAG TPA: hypothetical protein VF408_00175 [Sediminibacterium sp.]